MLLASVVSVASVAAGKVRTFPEDKTETKAADALVAETKRAAKIDESDASDKTKLMRIGDV
jgi:hypothetical protein